MRFFAMPKLTLVILFFFLFGISGCSSSDSETEDNPNWTEGATEKTFQNSLRDFNAAMEDVVVDMALLIDSIENLNEMMETGNDMQVDYFADQLEDDIDLLMGSIEAMDFAEADIQAVIGDQKIEKAIGITLLGAGLVIGGLYSFGRYCSGKSDELSEARKRRDDAADKGDHEKYRDAKSDMGKIGEDLIQELGTKVATDMVLSPINPSSATGLILKEAAGNAFQKGLKVISSTDKCKNGYDTDGCVIGVSETDASGKTTVAGSSSSTIVVGGKDISRVIIKEANIPPGPDKEVIREPVPIEKATPEIIAANDEGAYEPNDEDYGVTSPSLTLSYDMDRQDSESITYHVAAAVGGVKGTTNVTLEVQNALTSGATKTLHQDGTIIWSVTVLENNGVVTVHRSDTNERKSLTLPGKGVSLKYDGTYNGSRWVESRTGNCKCPIAGDLTVHVNGSTITGDFTGTITLTPSGQADIVEGIAGDGTIYNGTIGTIYPGITALMSGNFEGCCSGDFEVVR